MSDQPVPYDVQDGVATITLDRPDAMNSLDIATKEALRDAVQRRRPATTPCGASCSPAPAARSASGRTSRSTSRSSRTARRTRLFRPSPEHYTPIVTALATMPKPVIAAVNGVAAGAGR